MQAAVSIAGPYFTPYMLRNLEFSYAQYMVLLAASFVAKTTLLLAIGRRAFRWGIPALLRVGGYGIVPLSALWLVSRSFGYLLGLQIVSGCVWACYELAAFLLIFERIPVGKRTAVLTLYNVAHAAVTVTGSLVGAGLFRISGSSAYLVIFAASGVARLLTVPLQLRLGPMPDASWSVIMRVIGARPAAGVLWRPLLTVMTRGKSAGGRRPKHESLEGP
jgi:hypothetical protein